MIPNTVFSKGKKTGRVCFPECDLTLKCASPLLNFWIYFQPVLIKCSMTSLVVTTMKQCTTYMLSAHVEYSVDVRLSNSNAGETAGVL